MPAYASLVSTRQGRHTLTSVIPLVYFGHSGPLVNNVFILAGVVVPVTEALAGVAKVTATAVFSATIIFKVTVTLQYSLW